ncbi:alpha/beta hydrolase [Enterovirga rhinocerotis]|uniref:Esterase n=1 Tax=Enterovirga rhinocerotis TaxID=1339210 RepID=A0A4R7BSK6_9HYPH|nr:alpha/beta hydrolase-fold protein [Enterovirga rhinocerotis]TDR87067.1 hypothetical protein EV668_4146 [Enterovirga rhinocerotis]
MALDSLSSERSAVAVLGAFSLDVATRGGAAYRIFVWRPDAPAPPAGYPVTYLLDGNAVFGTAVDIARLQQMGFGPKPNPPGAIVAIGYPGDDPISPERRTLDLTPAAPAKPLPPRPDGRPQPPSGGADSFLDIIESEIKPAVARHLPLDPARTTLFGHSFGGLFTLHCLFTRPHAFAAYVAASPSIWWNPAAILGSERTFAARPAADRARRLLITVGDGEQPPADAASDEAFARRLAEARMVDHARDMAARLAAMPGLTSRFHLFAGESHGSVIPAALSLGLRFAAETSGG